MTAQQSFERMRTSVDRKTDRVTIWEEPKRADTTDGRWMTADLTLDLEACR